MRAYEYYSKKGMSHLNRLLETPVKSLGLLCSFDRINLGSSGLYYDFEELKNCISELCKKYNLNFNIVGQNQNSLDWMDEVYKVILESHLIIIDVSDPRPNVTYELGIACSLRASDTVVITRHRCSTFECSEVFQLQILIYNCLHDLEDKLIQHFEARSWPIEDELDTIFANLHHKLNFHSMTLLFQMLDGHRKRRGGSSSHLWHISFQSNDIISINSALELIENGLAKYE